MITGVLVLLGIVLFQAGDIKELVKRNYKRARRLVIGSRVAGGDRDPRSLPLGSRLPGGADGQDADPRRHGAEPRSGRGRLQHRGRPDRTRRDRRDRPRPAERGGRGDRRVRHDRHAGLRRLAPAYLGGPPTQHRHRRAAGGEVRLHLVRAAQAGAGVPSRGRVHRRSDLRAGSDRRRDHDAARLVAHPRLTGAHGRGDPGAQGLRPASDVRVRLPVVGQVGGAPAQLVRPGGDRALLHAGSDAHAGARRAGPRVHRLRGHARSLEAGARGGSADHDPRGRRELRTGREGPGVRRGGAARPRHDVHPLHHAERHRDPDDRRHGRHGVAGVAGGDDDGPRHAPDPEVPRPRSAVRA